MPNATAVGTASRASTEPTMPSMFDVCPVAGISRTIADNPTVIAGTRSATNGPRQRTRVASGREPTVHTLGHRTCAGAGVIATVDRAGAFGGGFGGEIATPQTLSIQAVTVSPSISSGCSVSRAGDIVADLELLGEDFPGDPGLMLTHGVRDGWGSGERHRDPVGELEADFFAQVVDRAHDFAGGAFVAEVVVELEVEGHGPRTILRKGEITVAVGAHFDLVGVQPLACDFDGAVSLEGGLDLGAVGRRERGLDVVDLRPEPRTQGAEVRDHGP